MGSGLEYVPPGKTVTFVQDRPEYEISNAFTTHTVGGNPAAIVFLTEGPSDYVLEKIRDIFNQPIVVYVFPPKANTLHKQGVAAFCLRWYGPWSELTICGHGTLSAAEAIFRKLNPSEEITTLEFQTSYGILTAQRVNDKISMDFPAGTTIPASTEGVMLVKEAFCLALGKSEVSIRYAGYGGPGYENYLFVEVDISEELSAWKLDAQHFAKFAPRTHILVTSASRQAGISYETRIFAPAIGVPEDHACGSAHCLNTPYWAAKHGYPSGEEQYAKAVSGRGGDIWSTYFEGDGNERGRVRLRGHVKLTASGTLDPTDIEISRHNY
ncbi:hypothetical protein B0H11DRAFT_1710573 [Mycena galericulata]|nr:hypothetical protein B0H11DRAFT_1710573 [Mycena galericulata]